MALPRQKGDDLLRIADLSRSLSLPESTIRYYCKRFADKLPQVGSGRQRRYKPETLGILQEFITPLRRDKSSLPIPATPNTMTKHAKKLTPKTKERASTPDSGILFAGQIMEFMDRQTQALQQIAVAMTLFASRQNTEIPLLPEAIAENVKLRGDIDELRSQLTNAAESHKNDLDQTRKWLARLSEAMANRTVN